jgi:UDP-N-acetylmuramoyl-L-alanyl-D-glutamate--2,6-diaminopimelate ligase
MTSIRSLLESSEPTDARPLGQLADRLQAEGRFRGARVESGPIGPAGIADTPIHGLAFDSRAVRPGMLFVALPGLHVDGHDYIDNAARAGAAAAIVERPVPDTTIPQIVVERSQIALATAACWWYGDPSRDLGVVGITGTDGKTTTAFLGVAALETSGLSAGMIGTIDTKIGAVRESNAEHATTPEAPVLQSALKAMIAAGNAVAVVETTSHALALERVGGVAYDVAIVTNLTHEHLEFHGTWEAYRDAKLSLFERLRPGPANPAKQIEGRPWPKLAIVNADDASAGLFAGVAQEAGARLVTYGTDPSADVRATRVEEDATGVRMTIDSVSGQAQLTLRLAGRFNVHNALAVVALGEGLGLDPAAVRSGLESVDRVPGRMERVDAGQPFEVIVDYAHSPASLEKVLELLGPVAAARAGGIIAVFGSAGERDTAKRPMMGRLAGEHARLVIVTDEDPRGEDREQILDDIARGAEAVGRRRGHDLLLIPDRAAAIEAAIERARAGDIVLLAGKGHETSIIGPDGPVPWDERRAASEALAAMGYRPERALRREPHRVG